MTALPPKPAARPRKTSLWRYLRLFRQDILSAQPDHLFNAWMAEFRTPFFRSYLINDPEVVSQILKGDPQEFPKSTRVAEGLRPLLGDTSVFLTNGAAWASQRRIIDPAFAGGGVAGAVPLITAACQDRIAALAEGSRAPFDIEPVASHLAADIIFRVLFSVPITDALASAVFTRFQAYQRAGPLVNLGAFLSLPRWVPRLHRGAARNAARDIRAAMAGLVDRRASEISAGQAPDDLATRLMTAKDPETGQGLDRNAMIDQVAIFFLAGHETSAAALSWALYLVAGDPGVSARVREEIAALDPENLTISDVSKLGFTRNVFRETLRLYPPVPMMVRTPTGPQHFRKRDVTPGAQLVISPWHLHRHRRLWSDPDAFRPDRFTDPEDREAVERAYLPFSTGARVCPGAGLAMTEGVLCLALLVRAFDWGRDRERVPVPVAHLTTRSKDGIWLSAHPH